MMGKSLRCSVCWCLWFIPVVAVFGRSLDNQGSKGRRNPEIKLTSDSSKVSEVAEDAWKNYFFSGGVEGNNIEAEKTPLLPDGTKGLEIGEHFDIGLTTQPQAVGSICHPEKIVDYAAHLQLQENGFQFQQGQDIRDEKLFVCTRHCFTNVWIHHGPSITLNLNPQNNKILRERNRRESTNAGEISSDLVKRSPSDFAQNSPNLDKKAVRNPQISDAAVPDVEIVGMSFEYESDKKRVEYDSHGSPKILEDMPVKIRLYGKFVQNSTYFKLSKFQKCDDPNNHQQEVQVQVDSSGTVGEVDIVMPHAGELHEVFLCLKSSKRSQFVRQGETEEGSLKPWLVIRLYQAMLPIWLHLSLLTLLLVLSGLFSGLNLGLMSLNKTDLKIIINTGTSDERHHAAAIAPVRNHGNFLLCCLLFSNVLVNASLTILVDDLTSGLIAIVMSTLSIVIFGEIIPQAICSRHGLAVGAKTIYVTKFFMFLTFPLAYPLSKILDKILGEEIGSVYTRERLKELLRVTKDYHGLETEEVGIISGALDMKTKTVKDIMVRLDNSFMLPIDAVLDFDTMAEVEYHGYSRIPIYEHERANIVALLNVKQLTLLDANDNIPLKTVIEYYQNKLFFVFENTRLDYMFRTFREGSRGHMAFVQRINDEGPGDPFYETIGLVTMEDVLEELLQAEIMDESDIGKQAARLANLNRPKNSAPYDLMKRKPKASVEIPPPLALAAVQFLNTSVEPFNKNILSVPILHRLVASSAQYIKLPKHRGTQQLPDLFLYESGKPSEYFIMILDGRVEVTVGQEKLTYESGSFTTFGKDFLITELALEKSGAASPQSADKPELKPKRRSFIPDYTVRVVTDLHYLMLKYSAYKAAMLATGIEMANADPTKSQNKNWQDEIEKMLEGGGGDDDATSETSRRPKLSRDESFKTSYMVVGEADGVSRKISIPVISETDHLPEHVHDEKVNEETKLL